MFSNIFIYVSYLILYLYNIFVGENVFFWVTLCYEYLCEWDGCGWRDESCNFVLFRSKVCVKNFPIVFVL